MGSKTPSVTTTSSAPPPEVMKRYNEVMDRASGVAETPYQAYGGQLTAGQNATQQNATAGLGAVAGYGDGWYNLGGDVMRQGVATASGAQPYFQQAADYTAKSTGPLNLSQYLSPYQQNVIDTTMAQMHQSDAMAQNSGLGAAIKNGSAFGGDRAGLAAAELERNQGMNRNSTIAGLNNQNYTQAISAAQNEMARYGQAAQTSAGLGNSQISAGQGLGALGTQLTNVGTQYATTAREGFNAALAAGTQQQATQQAGLTADYQQWQAAQQFPYAQTSWLSGIQSGLGSLSGGTGSTTAPAPNPMNQILGLGATAAGAFMASDERVKEDIKLIGKSFDGQRIYSYKYRGEPNTQIGLMAQDVEKSNPDAVREFGGVKHVDYERATEDAADKGGFAQGGAVMPYSGAPSFIPVISMTTGRGPPAAPKAAEEKQQNLSSLGAVAGKGLAGMVGPGDPMSLAAPGVQAGLGVAGPWADPTAGLGGLYARGGSVPFRASGGLVPDALTFEDRFGPVREAVTDGTFDPQGANYHTMNGAPEFANAGLGAVASTPLPASRPAGLGAVAEMIPDASAYEPAQPRGLAAARPLPREIVGEDAGWSPNVMAYDAPRGGLAPPAGYAPPVSGGVVPQESRQGSLGGLLPYLSPEAKASLMASGLAMMSSRSPNLGNALGDAGQVGLGTYYGALSGKAATEAKAREAERDYALGVRKLDQSALEARDSLSIQRGRLALEANPAAIRQLQAMGIDPKSPDARKYLYPKSETDPEGKLVTPGAVLIKDGKVAFDNKMGSTMAKETAEFLADRVLAGDTKALVGLGRGAQGAENLTMINGLVAEKARERGIDARGILTSIAEQAGQLSSERSLGTRRVAFGMAEKAMEESLPLALAASEQVGRTQFRTLTRLIQAGQTEINDPKLKQFLIATDTAAKDYARTINPTGVLRESDIAYARKILSTADSPEAYKAGLQQLYREAQVMKRAIERETGELRSRGSTGAEKKETHFDPSKLFGPEGTKPSASKPARVRQNGHDYQLDSNGNYVPVK